MEKVSSYKDLKMWQRATDLALAVYAVSKNFPQDGLYGLTSQIRRVASEKLVDHYENCVTSWK